MIAYHSTCKVHPFQDKKYGFKIRVVNPKSNHSMDKRVTCTVCGELFSLQAEAPKKKKK